MSRSEPSSIDSDQIARLVAALRATKSELGWLLEEVGANTIAEMTPSQYVHAMSALQRRRAYGSPSTDSSSGPS
jgi:hypothetical protein